MSEISTVFDDVEKMKEQIQELQWRVYSLEQYLAQVVGFLKEIDYENRVFFMNAYYDLVDRGRFS